MTAQEFGQRVYQLRMARGWTQEMVADRAGLTVRTIQKIEAHQMDQAPVETVQKLLVAFQCSWNDLLGSPAKIISAAAMPPLPKKK